MCVGETAVGIPAARFHFGNRNLTLGVRCTRGRDLAEISARRFNLRIPFDSPDWACAVKELIPFLLWSHLETLSGPPVSQAQAF